MRGMLAQLSPHEETALRKIAGGVAPIDPAHTRRLRDLGLISRVANSWHRHEQLVKLEPA